jgi:transitional endoplasmic reticulum ATPase
LLDSTIRKYQINDIDENFLELVANRTEGFNRDDIDSIIDRAAVNAIKEGRSKINKEDILLSIKKAIKKKHDSGKNDNKFEIYYPGDINVKLSNVVGNDDAKEKINDIIEFIRDPKKYTDIGLENIYKGVLFYGPPGTGKTLLAKAIAGETNGFFIQANGVDFEDKYFGESAKLVKLIFEEARKYSTKNKPVIIFIDEIDVMANKRAEASSSIVNALLTEMSGFKSDNNVIVIAATNMNPEKLDPALMRPGRFDVKIHIDLPSEKNRKKLLEIHSEKYKLSNNVNQNLIDHLSKETEGYSGADIEFLLKNAAIRAIQKGKNKISKEDILLSVEEITKQKHNTDMKFTVYRPGDIKINLGNIIGNRDAKGKISNIIQYIKDSKKYTDIGLEKTYSGILLYGPPGTGKTLLAKSIAGEMDSTFIQANGTDFKKIYLGEGPALVKEIFSLARKYSRENKPTIIFIDEIDAIATKRGEGVDFGGAKEANAVVNTLLTEMSGFQGDNRVIVVAATNMNPKALDPALMRSGRFDMKIQVNLPNKEDRIDLIDMYGHKYLLNKNINNRFIYEIADSTNGFSGADVELLMREAAMIAINRNSSSVSQEDIINATATIKGV